jgi:UrcA family protein
MSLWTILTTIVFMTAIAFAATTFAAPLSPVAAGPRPAAVSVSDLDLGSEAGATVALARIDHAVLATCGKAPSPAAATAADTYRRCAEAVMEPALSALGEPVVSAVDTRNRDLLMFVASR